MLLFETKLKFAQYFLSILGVFYVIPIIYIFSINDHYSLVYYLLGAIFILIALVQVSFTLKSFHVYDENFVIRRPLFFWKPKTVYKNNEIGQIRLKQSNRGLFLIVKTKTTEESFMLIYSGKTLKTLVDNLQKAGIKVNIEFKLK